MIKPYYQDDYVTMYNEDCSKVLPFLDKHDLLLTDPPYGIGENARKSNSRNVDNGSRRGNAIKKLNGYDNFYWDEFRVEQWIIDLAISKANRSIVFGGNYYDLPPAKCWLVWDKENGDNDFADAELAWTNLDKAVRLKRHLWNGLCRKHNEVREHPTQKPQDVMSWCIEKAGEPVVSVLDPFCGSGTTLVAAKLRNIKATGIEREERYCEIAANRLSQEVLPLCL